MRHCGKVILLVKGECNLTFNIPYGEMNMYPVMMHGYLQWPQNAINNSSQWMTEHMCISCFACKNWKWNNSFKIKIQRGCAHRHTHARTHGTFLEVWVYLLPDFFLPSCFPDSVLPPIPCLDFLFFAFSALNQSWALTGLTQSCVGSEGC
jgi:hypothetical protein